MCVCLWCTVGGDTYHAHATTHNVDTCLITHVWLLVCSVPCHTYRKRLFANHSGVSKLESPKYPGGSAKRPRIWMGQEATVQNGQIMRSIMNTIRYRKLLLLHDNNDNNNNVPSKFRSPLIT